MSQKRLKNKNIGPVFREATDKKAWKGIHKLLEQSATNFPQKTALIFGKREYSYHQLNLLADKIAMFLEKKTSFQDRILLLLPNSPELVAAYFGILKVGRIAVPTDPSISEETLKTRASFLNAAMVLTNRTLVSRVRRIVPQCLCQEVEFFFLNFDKKIRSLRRTQHVTPSTIASVLFTTGTTSQPKGVMVKHANALATVKNILRVLRYSSASRDLNALPLSHSFGLGNIHTVLAVGGTVILYRNFINLKEILEGMKQYSATSFSATPPIFEYLTGPLLSLFKRYNQGIRLILTNSAPIPPRTIQKILKAAPRARFFTYYGLTEASRSTFIDYRSEPDRLTSVGKAAPSVTITVRSDNGKILPPERTGEVYVKGPNVVSGYWNNIRASRKAIRNGWLATGDYGHLDRDGYLYLKGRKDDVINIGGNKVYPHEIEEVLRRHKDVEDVAVASVQDELLGEVAWAFIVPRNLVKVKEETLISELKKICYTSLEPFKIPKKFEIRGGLPKTSSGKLQRKLLL